jgi:hypothetical protein
MKLLIAAESHAARFGRCQWEATEISWRRQRMIKAIRELGKAHSFINVKMESILAPAMGGAH